MRKFLNKYGIYLAVLAILLAAFAVYFGFRRKDNNAVHRTMAFYVDEDTNEESIHSLFECPPLIGKNGNPTVVLATKISCDGGKTSRIAYLEKYSPEVQARLQTLPPDDTERPSLMEKGLLIRLPAPDSPWVPASSPPGAQIQENVSCPDGKPFTIVQP